MKPASGGNPGRPPFSRDPAIVRAVHKALCDDLPLDKVARVAGISPRPTHQIAYMLGFRRMYLTAEERAMVLRSRAAKPMGAAA